MEKYKTLNINGVILDKNKNIIKTSTEISSTQMMKLISPWIDGGTALEKYLPHMWEVEFPTHADMQTIQTQITPHAQFLTHKNAWLTAF